MVSVKLITGVNLLELDADKVAEADLKITQVPDRVDKKTGKVIPGKKMVYFRDGIPYEVECYEASEIENDEVRTAANKAIVLAGHTPHRKLILAEYGVIGVSGAPTVSTKATN